MCEGVGVCVVKDATLKKQLKGTATYIRRQHKHRKINTH